MNLSQVGLIFDFLGAILLACETSIKTSVIGEDYLIVGHGRISLFWRVAGPIGYGLIAIGFLHQLIGSYPVSTAVN